MRRCHCGRLRKRPFLCPFTFPTSVRTTCALGLACMPHDSARGSLMLVLLHTTPRHLLDVVICALLFHLTDDSYRRHTRGLLYLLYIYSPNDTPQ